VCGERLRADDGAAVLAAERLPRDVRALADVEYVGQLSIEALLEIPDGSRVIVADAAVGVEAGRVITVPLAGVATAGGAAPASSHALPPDQVIALAAEVRGSMLEGVFVGIGAVAFEIGEPPSAAVAAGLAAFTSTLAAEIRRLAADSPQG
jgi:hydrogenase maturation protease